MTTFTPGSAPPPHAPIDFSIAAVAVFKCTTAERSDPSAASGMVSDSGAGRRPLGAPFDAADRSEDHAALEDGVRNAGEMTAVDAWLGASEARAPTVSKNQLENQGQQKTERFKNRKLNEKQRREPGNSDHANVTIGTSRKSRSIPCIDRGVAKTTPSPRAGLMIISGAGAAIKYRSSALRAEHAPTLPNAENFAPLPPPPHDFGNNSFAMDFTPLGLREGRKTQKAFRHSRRHAPLPSIQPVVSFKTQSSVGGR